MPNKHNKPAFIAYAVCVVIVICTVAPMAVKAEEAADSSAEPPKYEAELLWAQAAPGEVSGEVLYQAHCSNCHRTDGKGFQARFPPLVQSDFLSGNPQQLLAVVMGGLSGPITVNGVRYDEVMPPISYLYDQELALVMTYVLNQWGNTAGKITTKEVAAYRKAAALASPSPHPQK